MREIVKGETVASAGAWGGEGGKGRVCCLGSGSFQSSRTPTLARNGCGAWKRSMVRATCSFMQQLKLSYMHHDRRASSLVAAVTDPS